MVIRLTVFFEDPFWVGLFERTSDGLYEVSRFVFGAEPKDYDVYDFVLNSYLRLKFTRPITVQENGERRVNPKRLQREAHSEVKTQGIGTKAQQALQLEYEALKQERKVLSKERREELQRLKFAKKQEKKKEKKKGH